MEDISETLMKHGEWLIRRSKIGKRMVWVSHTGCYDIPRRVREGVCHSCKEQAPEAILGFLSMVKWKK